jgi:voltage-dependent calcium channel L type alpha-1D
VTAGYAFAVVFNVECILKLIAMGKYYFWVSHNIFDFALIIGTDVGIFMSLVFPNLSIGPLATLLRAFRIGRVLNLLKEKKSLKMLIDTIFYILPILIKIIGFM